MRKLSEKGATKVLPVSSFDAQWLYTSFNLRVSHRGVSATESAVPLLRHFPLLSPSPWYQLHLVLLAVLQRC